MGAERRRQHFSSPIYFTPWMDKMGKFYKRTGISIWVLSTGAPPPIRSRIKKTHRSIIIPSVRSGWVGLGRQSRHDLMGLFLLPFSSSFLNLQEALEYCYSREMLSLSQIVLFIETQHSQQDLVGKGDPSSFTLRWPTERRLYGCSFINDDFSSCAVLLPPSALLLTTCHSSFGSHFSNSRWVIAFQSSQLLFE